MHLHCNKCFCLKKSDYKTKFYITSCRHVICGSCIQEKCVVCGHKGKTALIERNMSPSAAAFFINPQKKFEQFQNTLRFWQDQEESLCAYTLNQMPKKIQDVMNRCKRLQTLEGRLNNEIEKNNHKIKQCQNFLNFVNEKNSKGFMMLPPPLNIVKQNDSSSMISLQGHLRQTTRNNNNNNTQTQAMLAQPPIPFAAPIPSFEMNNFLPFQHQQKMKQQQQQLSLNGPVTAATTTTLRPAAPPIPVGDLQRVYSEVLCNIHLAFSSERKRIEAERLYKTIMRREVSIGFLEKQLTNQLLSMHAKDIIAIVVREVTRAISPQMMILYHIQLHQLAQAASAVAPKEVTTVVHTATIPTSSKKCDRSSDWDSLIFNTNPNVTRWSSYE